MMRQIQVEVGINAYVKLSTFESRILFNFTHPYPRLAVQRPTENIPHAVELDDRVFPILQAVPRPCLLQQGGVRLALQDPKVVPQLLNLLRDGSILNPILFVDT